IKSVQACPRSHSVATKIRAPPLIGPDGGRTLESLSAHPICSRRLSSTISSSMRFSIPLTCLTHAFQRALDTHAISGLFSISFCLAVMERHDVMQRRKTTGPTSCGVVRILTGHKSASQHGTVKLQRDRKSTRLNSSHVSISYAVFCLKKKNDARGVAVDSLLDGNRL